jgi:hypothetical protein
MLCFLRFNLHMFNNSPISYCTTTVNYATFYQMISTLMFLHPLTLLYKSEMNAVLCPLRVSLPLKKICDMSSDSYSVGSYSPLQIKMAILRTFLKNWNLLGRVWQPAAHCNGCLEPCSKRPLLTAEAATPDQITQQNSSQRARGPSRQ